LTHLLPEFHRGSTLEEKSRIMSFVEISYLDCSRELGLSSVDKRTGWIVRDGVWKNAELKLEFALKIDESADGRRFSLPLDSLKETGDCRIASVTFQTGFLQGTEGDDAEFILPCDLGVSCRLGGKAEGEYILPGFSHSEWPPYVMNMLMAAKVTPDSSRLLIIDDCRYDSGFRLRTNYGQDHAYQVEAMFRLRRYVEAPLPEDSPAVLCREIPGGLAEMAACYRAYIVKRNKITPLATKAAESAPLEKASESLLIRLRMAAKPVPSPVEEQTPDNQPEPKVFMTFDDAVNLAEECARQELDSVDFTLVGWNYGGHDGAFPQILPIEEKLGGETAMIRAVNRIKELGYQVGVHDNFSDSYTLADNLDPADWALHPDGTSVDGNIWGGGRAHLLCPQQVLASYFPEHTKELERFGLNGTYYVDVVTLEPLHPCANPAHPRTLKQAAECWKSLLAQQRLYSGVSMSEGAREWALPEMDRAYAAANRPDAHVELPFADATVPLFPLVFHGLVLYNSCRMTVNAMPGDRLYLENIAYGGLPLLYFHQRFQQNTSIINRGCDDLTLDGEAKLREDVSRIKRVAADIKRLAPLQTVFMRDYEILAPGLVRTTYENGSQMVLNFTGELIALPDGCEVAARDFVVMKS
jgi:hypothetical protein